MSTILKRAILVVAVLALAAGATAMAFGPHGGKGHRGGGPFGGFGPRMVEELELTEDQVDQIRTVLRSSRDGEAGETMRAFAEARRSVHELMFSPTADEQQVLEAIRSSASLAEEAALARFRVSREIQSVLTPEQLQRATELRAERQQRRSERRERRLERRGLGSGPGGSGPDELGL